ncbi:TIGR04219 family outer membrane beta-barrel protein [Gayadomonas joobiniege]|uniref:TIGR04219 family outer membrane beta-barrel protein n=1 Tax=Gayadomonas joobiniege TaxID=1234606 RepID=UPI00035ED3A8|nr:TIGR04219 family outer membrane beta-barrel protein [Gayadomonas joobiniege]
MNKTNKLKLALASALLVGSMQAKADTVLGLYAGAQYWNIEPEGQFGSSADDQETFAFDDAGNASYYVALEHLVPIIPNIKLRHNQMEDLQGGGVIDNSYTFAGQTYPENTNVSVNADLSNTDYILYYELFDNGLFSFDFGLNVKHIDGLIQVTGVPENNSSGTSASSSEDFSGFVPMGYLAAEVALPGTGFSVYADGSLLTVGDHSLTDYQLGLAYEFVDNLAVDMSVQLGYRSFALELDDLEDIYSDLEFNGAYAGLQIHF